MIALLVMTDGRRDCIVRTLASYEEMVIGPVTRKVIHDDSGDPVYNRWLADRYPDFEIVCTAGRSGFGGAITSAWRWMSHGDQRFVFVLEDDFVFLRPVDLVDLAATLDAHPELVQLVLRRQPWNPQEHAAGGVVEQHPEAYTDRDGYLEHRRFYSTNPNLCRMSLVRGGWIDGPQSEGRFGWRLLHETGSPEVAADEVRFGFWGARDSGVWVEHIGHVRAGTGY